MAKQTITTIVLIVFLVHGMGHFQGVITSIWLKASSRSTAVSWLLQGLGKRTNRILCFLLYLLPALGFIAAAMSFRGWILPESAWHDLALYSAFVSMAGLILFPNALAMIFNKIGALAVNLITMYSLLGEHWPEEIF
ncbi:hypothetical protein ACFLR8_04745 [Bacteroidota bacterium]